MSIDFNNVPPQQDPARITRLYRLEPDHDFQAGLARKNYYNVFPMPSGKITRFAVEGDKQNEKSGWYVWHDDPKYPVAFFGDWRSGEQYEWRGYDENELTPEELASAREKREAQARAKDAALANEREHCRKLAAEIWARAKIPQEHVYLHKKNLPTINLRQDQGSLLVPVTGPDGALRGLQRIWPDGEKRFLPGTEKKGGFCQIPGEGQIIGLAEGWATGASVNLALGWQVYVAFDAGNLIHVARWLQETYPDAKIVNLADDDRWKQQNAGRLAAERLERELGIKPVFPVFANTGSKPTDWNDLWVMEGPEAVKSQIEAAMSSPKQRFQFLTGSDIMAMQPTHWRVQDILPAQGLAAIFGPPGTGKTFLTLDMALKIASGASWFGYDTYSAPVLYINQESGWGLKKRLAAWLENSRKPIPENIRFLLEPVRIVDDAGELSPLIPECAVTIIDTLNSVAAGLDENSAKDMGLIIEAAQAIRRKTQGLVILIHHTGKDTDKGARGHSSLKGALDAEIQLSRAGHDRKWTLTKSKESEDGLSGCFLLEKIVLGQDDHCHPLSSCYVREVAPEETASQDRKLTDNQALALESLKTAIEESGGDEIDLETWRQYFYSVCTADNQHAKKVAFQRVRSSLQKLGKIEVNDDVYKIADGTAQ